VTSDVDRPPGQPGVGSRTVAALITGTTLNPLNSSMIAVALVDIQRDLGISTVTATWLVSAFYLSAAVGQPLTGRLADLLGPRRLFVSGMALTGLTGLLALAVPSFAWLVVLRVLQAIGTSPMYPSALAVLRGGSASSRPPSRQLGALSVAAYAATGVGPVLGGVLVTLFGWQAVFAVNVPLALAGTAAALAWIPPDRPFAPAERADQAGGVVAERSVAGEALRRMDLPAVVAFVVALTSFLAFLLDVGTRWWLLPIAAIASVLFVLRESTVPDPFIDVRLVARGRLPSVFGQFTAVNVIFYSVFFGLPLWLEHVRGASPEVAGFLLLPVAIVGALTTPIAARSIDRSGPRPSLVIGALTLTVGSLLLALIEPSSPTIAIVGAGLALGVPNGFNNLGLQAALYENAPADRMASTGGLLQTCRYLGAILSAALLGTVYGSIVDTAGFHQIALVMAALSAVLVVWSLATGRSRPG
jgi:MFS family permease